MDRAALAVVLLASVSLPSATVAQGEPSASADATAPTVFYRTIGGGHDRLYRRVLDGAHQPELIAAREAAADIDDPQGSWFLSPDGSVVIRVEPRRETPDDDIVGGLEAIPLRDDAPSWRLDRRWLYGEQVSWSSDGRWVGDGRSLTDVADGTTRDLETPEDWEFLGFATDGSGLLYTSSDDDDLPTLWRLDPATGDRGSVLWGTVGATGRIGLSTLSPSLGQAIAGSDDPATGEPRVVVRDLRTGSDTVVSGLPEGADPVGYDATGRVALARVTSRDETGVPPRRDLTLYAVREAAARLVWQGPGQGYPEPMLTREGRYVLLHPHYDDPSLLLVALDGSGATPIPVPADVSIVDPVGLLAGSVPPSSDLALAPSPPLDPGTVIDGAPSVIVTSVELGAQDGLVGRIQVVVPSTGGVRVLAETTVPIPPGTRTDAAGVVAAPRPGHPDVLILSGSWSRPWVFRWTPGHEPRRVRSLGGFRRPYGPVWSPDGRRLVVRTDGTGRRFAVFDARLRLERTIKLPSRWEGARVAGWTADSTHIVFDPPVFAYASGGPGRAAMVASVATDPMAARRACENEMPMATVSVATGTLTPKRSTRELDLRFAPGSDGRAATGEWAVATDNDRAIVFQHGCPILVTRSRVPLPDGLQHRRLSWSRDGTTMFVLAGSQASSQLLAYRRPWSAPRQEPRVTTLHDVVRYLGAAAPGNRWLVVEGEGRLGGGSAGLLDRRSGEVHWIEGAVQVQGWTETPEG